MFGHVCVAQTIDVAKKGSRNIQSDIAMADDDSCITAGEIWVEAGILRKPIIPSHECTRRVYTLDSIFAGNSEGTILASAIGEEDCAVVVAKLWERDVSANLDVPDEVEIGGSSNFVETVLAVLKG